MKRVYVQFFIDDGSTKGLLIDERWTVAETMQHLADRMKILLTPEYAIVEELPDLHIRTFAFEARSNFVVVTL